MKKIIAITRGDGCGPEVVNEAIKILKTVSEFTDYEFELKDAQAGGEVWKKHGTNLPEQSFETIIKSDALLFGALGLPDLPPGV
ncbi:MAG: isocitrate/isopropylmalate family dehydrogenase, partial [Promethearchaeota archaeon]